MSESEYSGMDRRKFLRANGYIKVAYTILSTEVEEVYQDQIDSIVNNISVSGIAFEAADELPVASLLKMDICLPLVEKPIQAFGKVIWQKKNDDTYNTGVAFFWIVEEDRQAIKKYIRTKTDKIYEETNGQL